MVTIPAVIEAGAETKFCVSLLQPNEAVDMTITLISSKKKEVLFQKTSSTEFHTCVQFQVTSSYSIFFSPFTPILFGHEKGIKPLLLLFGVCELMTYWFTQQVSVSPPQAPVVHRNEIQDFKVKVQGSTFSSEEVRKVMFKVYRPMTLIQTDKPIYTPGQTGNYKVTYRWS